MTACLARSALLGLAVAALAVTPALANGGDGNERSERAKGAPGWACKQQGHEPGTQAFRECVTALAKARGKRNGNGNGNGPSERGRTAPGRVCKQQGHEPGTRAFRDCVTELAKARGKKQGQQRRR